MGDISFAGTTLKNATLEGLQNLRRSGDIYAGDWYTKLWSIIFGDFKVDYLVIRFVIILFFLLILTIFLYYLSLPITLANNRTMSRKKHREGKKI